MLIYRKNFALSSGVVATGLLLLTIFLQSKAAFAVPQPNKLDGGQTVIVIKSTLFVDGLGDNMAGLEFGPDGRLFVTFKTGLIKIIELDGTVLETPFLDISDLVSVAMEQGLVTLVFHPDYQNNGYIYVLYTDLAGDVHLARFTVSASDPDQIDRATEMTLLQLPQPTPIHNGSDLHFGPDGYLYVGLGDGGDSKNAQDGTNLLGSILRLDVDGSVPYAIPIDNPFVGDSTVLDEIWVYGLRNPWRFTFDEQTGDLYLGDVGSGSWEEVDIQPATSTGGENYGWPCYEGNVPRNLNNCEDPATYTFPIYEYAHPINNCAAVIGGYVYRGSQYPIIDGHYLFIDFCYTRILGLVEDNGQWVAASTGILPTAFMVDFAQTATGELYVGGDGYIFELAAEEVAVTPQFYLPLITITD